MLKCNKCFEEFPFLIVVTKDMTRVSIDLLREVIVEKSEELWCFPCVVEAGKDYLWEKYGGIDDNNISN